jgi:hypothetical protein
MGSSTKAAISIIAVTSIAAVSAFTFAVSHARELGRSDPKKAANYRPPWFNFSETYTDGTALGVAVGASKVEAFEAAERAGLTVAPSGWGDNRAGGADLYERPELVAAMLRQPYLNFYDRSDLKRGMIVDFRDNRVVAIRVHYINSEAI